VVASLTGSDATPDNTHLTHIAGRFSRRIRGYAKGIPVVHVCPGKRKRRIDFLW